MTLGRKLQLLRKQQGLSQEALANQLSVSRQAVSKWELDASLPETENIIKLAKLFNVSFDYLLDDEILEIDTKSEAPAVKEKWNITPLTALCILIAVASAIVTVMFMPMIIIAFAQLVSVGFNASSMSAAALMALRFYTPIVLVCVSIFCVMLSVINKQRNQK